MSLSNLIGYLVAGALLLLAYVPIGTFSASGLSHPTAFVIAAYLLYSMVGKSVKANIAALIALSALAFAFIPGAAEAAYGAKYVAPLEGYLKNIAGALSLGVVLARLQF